MLTDQQIQSLRNLGDMGQDAADAIERLRRWKSTHAPRLEALQGLKDRAQAEAALGKEARASLASEREANGILTAEIASLQVKLEHALSHNAAEAEDAERYRWLRDKAQGEIVFDHTEGAKDGGSRFLLMVPFDGKRIGNYSELAARIDASVDAEMAKAAP